MRGRAPEKVEAGWHGHPHHQHVHEGPSVVWSTGFTTLYAAHQGTAFDRVKGSFHYRTGPDTGLDACCLADMLVEN